MHKSKLSREREGEREWEEKRERGRESEMIKASEGTNQNWLHLIINY